MKISAFKRILKENFDPKYHDLIDGLSTSLNNFSENIVTALNNNITIDDNLNMEYKTIDITVNSSGSPIITTQYQVSFIGKVRGISVEKAENLTNPNTYPTNAPFISFSQNDQVITIKHITGLPINNKFRLTILTKG